MTPFEKWYKRADTWIPNLDRLQQGCVKSVLKKTFEAGRKQGRKEATTLAEKAIALREMLNKPKGK